MFLELVALHEMLNVFPLPGVEEVILLARRDEGSSVVVLFLRLLVRYA